MKHPTICWAIALVLVVATGGCGSGGGRQVQTEVIPYTAEQQEARVQAKEARYRLRAGDVIKIAFKFETDLDQSTVLVLPDGYISPEGLRSSVKAAGRTVDELNLELESAYARDYRNPDLSVVIVEISSPEVYVLGMVKLPGMYKLPTNGVGVVQAIASAGGFLPDASRSGVVLIRASEEGFVLRSLDLDHLEDVGFRDLAVFDLQPYDVIYVPRTGLGDFKYYAESVFGTALNMSQFFWDIYAIANIDKVQTVIR